jgi:ribose-phosphate pyrophosphokinase
MPHSKLRAFYGTSHPELGKKIVRHLRIRPGKIKISRFACGEIYARVMENIRGDDCVIIQTCSSKVNEDLMELFIIIDAMRRASARSIAVVMPCFGYGRQDRKAASREPISGRLVANLLETAGANRIVTMDLHSDQIQGYFNIPMDTLTALPLFVQELKKKKLENMIVVAPDTGRAKVAKKLADRIGARLAILHKVRSGHHQVEALRRKGCNKDIYVVATHALLSGPAVERMKSAHFKEVIVTDCFPIPENKQFKGLKVLSAASLLGEAVRRNYENRSISSLFD